ncbi:MAG: ThuA domain-containing protein [Armatimonadota bacterium]
MKNLILSGGVAHDYAATSPMIAEILNDVSIDSDILGIQALEDNTLNEYDMMTINCVYWTCSQTPDWYDEWHYEMPETAKNNILNFVKSGKGILALHCATICFDDFPEYRKILGAWWDWGKSGHAPYQEQIMRVQTDAHPVVAGLTDFKINDELYTNPQITDSIEPLITAEWEGVDHPILWLREYESARVCYNALGHGIEAFMKTANRTLLKRSALWVNGINDVGGIY